MEGKILLSVGEEDQVSFDELITMLPTEISAEVLSEEETATAETIQIKNWTSGAYVQVQRDSGRQRANLPLRLFSWKNMSWRRKLSPIEAVVSLDGER